MKKIISIILFTTLIFTFFTTILANSGPVFWKGNPSSDVMYIQEDCPIIVQNEKLFFDFSNNDTFSDTNNGNVIANYEMFNPSNEAQTVQMAFPFVGNLYNFSEKDIAILEGGHNISYELYIGDVVNSNDDSNKDDDFDFENIVSTITDTVYDAKNFKENEKGKLYKFYVKSNTNETINFSIDFEYDYEKTKVIIDGFSRSEQNENKIRISSSSNEEQPLEIFVLGEDINLNINAFSDNELTKKTDLFTYKMVTKEIEIRDCLLKFMKYNTIKYKGIVSDNQLYNLYAKSLDDQFTYGKGFTWISDILVQNNYDRILTLVYTVVFSEKTKKIISVCYKTFGTMDRRETRDPLYSYNYILNPAKNWRDFNNLSIKVITPKEAPYIVKSNFEFKKEEDYVYTANFKKLPGEDISFSLYANEKITFLDKLEGILNNKFGYFTPFVILAVAICFIGVTIGIILRYKK